MKYQIEHEIHADLEGSGPVGLIVGLQALGFFEDPFIHPQGGRTEFVPLCHWTTKPANGREQNKIFEQTRGLAMSFGSEVEGYLESEVAHVVSDFPELEFNPAITLAASVENCSLKPGEFREDELHVEFSKNQTTPAIGRTFANSGWRQAFCPEPYGVGEIWTVQGSKSAIEEILAPTIHYLARVGGLVSCTLRREVVAHWWMSRPDLSMPPIIHKINWH